MPTYQYTCTDCDEALEVQQSFSDDSLTTCPVCEGRLRKVFNAVGVVFKGSGFYRNDSRSSNGDGSGKESGGEGGGKESGGEDKQPAAKESSQQAGGSVGDKSGAKGTGKNGETGGGSGTSGTRGGSGSSGSGASASSPAAVGAGSD